MSADSQRCPVGDFWPLVTVTPVMGKVVGFSLPTCCAFFGVWNLTLGCSPLHTFSSCYWVNFEKTSKLYPKRVAKNESINVLLAGRAVYFSLWWALQHIKKNMIKSISTQERTASSANFPPILGNYLHSSSPFSVPVPCFLGRWHSSLTQTWARKRSIESKWNLGQPFYKSLSTWLKCWCCALSFLPKRHHLIFSARTYQCNNCSH